MKRALLAALAIALLWPTTAHAGTEVDRAVGELRSATVYVSPGANLKLSGSEVSGIENEIEKAGTPIYVAVLPEAAAGEVGGDPSKLPSAIGQRLGKVTVATIAGKSFRAGSAVLPSGRAAEIATKAFNDHHSAGLTPVLVAFVRSVGAEVPRPGAAGTRTSPAKQDDGGLPAWAIVLAVLGILAVLVGLGVLVGRWLKRRREAEEERERRNREAYEEMTRYRKVNVGKSKAEEYDDGEVHQAEPKKGERVAGQDVRVTVNQAGSRWYPGGYYGGAFYYPGYYPGSFMEGMLWGSLLFGDHDRDVDVPDGDDRGNGGSDSSGGSGSDWAGSQGDWGGGGEDRSGGGGDFGGSDDVSYDPAPAPSAPDPEPSYDSGGGGSDWGGGGDSGGGFDSGGGGGGEF